MRKGMGAAHGQPDGNGVGETGKEGLERGGIEWGVLARKGVPRCYGGSGDEHCFRASLRPPQAVSEGDAAVGRQQGDAIRLQSAQEMFYDGRDIFAVDGKGDHGGMCALCGHVRKDGDRLASQPPGDICGDGGGMSAARKVVDRHCGVCSAQPRIRAHSGNSSGENPRRCSISYIISSRERPQFLLASEISMALNGIILLSQL